MTEALPVVSHLFIYPIKSLDRVAVERVTLLASGALHRDREYALCDSTGNFVNGKRHAAVHGVRSQFDLPTNSVTLSVSGSDRRFHMETERGEIETWLGDYFGFPIHLTQNREMGFPDDTASPGPTIVSTATLAAIAAWYPGMTLEEVRRRFRANIEISGVPAFWEDRLFAADDSSGSSVGFQIGDVRFLGVNPCQRCVVVTRNSQTGEAYHDFQKTFVAKRRDTLPDWAARSRFNHFYRLAINTRVPLSEVGKRIAIGDRLFLALV